MTPWIKCNCSQESFPPFLYHFACFLRVFICTMHLLRMSRIMLLSIKTQKLFILAVLLPQKHTLHLATFLISQIRKKGLIDSFQWLSKFLKRTKIIIKIRPSLDRSIQEGFRNSRVGALRLDGQAFDWIIQQFLKMDKSGLRTTEQQMRGENQWEEGEGRGVVAGGKEERLLCVNYQEQCFINNPLHKHNQQKQPDPQEGQDKLKLWSEEQERLLVELHNQKGNRWVQIARQLERSDNSVKNHYHSRLRRALRKINKCISDHFGPQGKLLKINMLSRIIQAAQGYYSEDVTPEAACAYRLKNQMLSFVDLSQQQCSQQQIDRVRSLFSQLTAFNQKNKKQDRTPLLDRTPSNKYKGKEIISLLQENMINQQRECKKKREGEDESILVDGGQGQEQVRCLPTNNVGYSSYYFYNQPIYPIYFSILEQTTPTIFSGKPSSFTFYSAENQKAGEPTWTSIPMGETL